MHITTSQKNKGVTKKRVTKKGITKGVTHHKHYLKPRGLRPGTLPPRIKRYPFGLTSSGTLIANFDLECFFISFKANPRQLYRLVKATLYLHSGIVKERPTITKTSSSCEKGFKWRSPT